MAKAKTVAPVPVTPDVVLNLSGEEAEQLRDITGSVQWDSNGKMGDVCEKVYNALSGAIGLSSRCLSLEVKHGLVIVK